MEVMGSICNRKLLSADVCVKESLCQTMVSRDKFHK